LSSVEPVDDLDALNAELALVLHQEDLEDLERLNFPKDIKELIEEAEEVIGEDDDDLDSFTFDGK
jgi:hypothetical protein